MARWRCAPPAPSKAITSSRTSRARRSPKTDGCARREVLGRIGDEIRRCNAGLPEATRIRRFIVLNKEFDADDDEITRTRKIRRRFVTEKYAAVLDAFYSGGSEVELSTEITFEDGRKSVLQSRLAIGDVDEPLPPAAARR